MTFDEVSKAHREQLKRDIETAKGFRNFYQRQLDELSASLAKLEPTE